MKLQLDENTLYAYINEAIKREINEGFNNPFGADNTPIQASPLAPQNQGRWYGQQIDLANHLQNRAAWNAEQQRKQAAGIRQNPLPISVDLFQYMYNTHYGGHLKVDGVWGPETEKAYQDYVRRGGSLQNYKMQQYAPGPNGPVRISENALKAYIDEAVRQELNEGLFSRGSSAAARNIVHSPITKKFFGRIKDAKSARKFIMGLRRGKPVEGAIESTGKPWRAVAQRGWKPSMKSKNVEFFVKDPVTNKWVKATGTDLNLAKQSFSHHLTSAGNLFNSAQRNMLGTGLVAGMGAGWAIDHNSHRDDPWNGDDDNPTPGPEPEPEPWDGSFPWDGVTPRYTPRPRPTPAPTPGPTPPSPEPVQPAREPVQMINPPQIAPGSVTAPKDSIRGIPEPNPNFPASVIGSMAKTAATSPAELSQREKNRTMRSMKNNAINAMNNQDVYQVDKDTRNMHKNMVKNAYRGIKRGDQNPNI